ncbi:MAG: UDP-N-acetylmuramate dehydrogenase [Candidatus Paceibacterota bacterium]
MKILTNIPLSEHTTFRLGGPAKFFCSVKNEKDIESAVKFATENKQKIFVLGEGSNVLFSDSGFEGLVIKMEMKGIKIEKERFEPDPVGEEYVYVTAAAGELWDSFVEKMVDKGLYGIENLSAVPGTVGAAPVQNIGAYGMEAAETVYSVRAYDTKSHTFISMSGRDCGFNYRSSLFKQKKDYYIITSVCFRLRKNGRVNISYRDLKVYFETHPEIVPDLKEVRKAVIEIRWNKLPDWKLWGNAGSFFKNPVITEVHYAELKQKYPDLPGYKEKSGLVKVPLGWILDKICNKKGVCVGNVCTHFTQALVIVAKPGAKSEEVVNLARQLIDEVKDKTGIEVEGEVEWVN